MQKQRLSELRSQLKLSLFRPFNESPQLIQVLDPFPLNQASSMNNVLLSGSDGGSISPIKTSTEKYISFSDDKITQAPPSYLRTNDSLEFEQMYDGKDIIGQGGHAIVRRCSKKNTQDTTEYAVKIFRTGEPEIINTIRKTFNINFLLKHSNICEAIELYIDERREQCYYVQEYCEWPSLEQIISTQKLTFNQARMLVRELLYTVDYIHMMGIAHRDIKPDNILVLLSHNKCQIKLIDFGVSKQFYTKRTNTASDMWTRTGNIFYQPPESFLGGGYNEKIDTWSVGIVLYQIIIGKLPFECDTIIDTIELIQKAQLDVVAISAIPKLLVDLLKRILHQNPTQRLSARESLMHPWFQSELKDDDKYQNTTTKDDASVHLDQFIPPHLELLNKLSLDGGQYTPDMKNSKHSLPEQNISKFGRDFLVSNFIHHIQKEVVPRNRFRTFSLKDIEINKNQDLHSQLIQSQWLINSVIMESPLASIKDIL